MSLDRRAHRRQALTPSDSLRQAQKLIVRRERKQMERCLSGWTTDDRKPEQNAA